MYLDHRSDWRIYGVHISLSSYVPNPTVVNGGLNTYYKHCIHYNSETKKSLPKVESPPRIIIVSNYKKGALVAKSFNYANLRLHFYGHRLRKWGEMRVMSL